LLLVLVQCVALRRRWCARLGHASIVGCTFTGI
jgi:hypothetical protein